MTKKIANDKILAAFRELVSKLKSGEEIEYEYFKTLSENLGKLYKTLFPSGSIFRLSERYQQIWLDPDFYLTPGSFMQTWLIQKYQIRPEDITEETLATWMYKFFADRFGNFEAVRLVDPTGLPSLEELGVESSSTDSSGVSAGCIVELDIAPESTYTEEWSADRLRCLRTADSIIPLYDGQREVMHLAHGAETISTNQLNSFVRAAADKVASVGSAGEMTFENSRPRRTSAPSGAVANILISRYIYRDSTGEIHERDLTNTGFALSAPELQEEIRAIEAPLIESRSSS